MYSSIYDKSNGQYLKSFVLERNIMQYLKSCNACSINLEILGGALY